MCGRYSQTSAAGALARRFEAENRALPFEPRQQIFPGQEAPIVAWEQGPSLRLSLWGLIPSWMKESPRNGPLINARAETLLEKPSFRDSLRLRRCLVPADAYYEWSQEPGAAKKTPRRLSLKTGEPFAFAGLWDLWRGPDGQSRHSFCIITTGANEAIAPWHPRMPVILGADDEKKWLAPTAPPNQLQELLRPYPSDGMRLLNPVNPDADGLVPAAPVLAGGTARPALCN